MSPQDFANNPQGVIVQKPRADVYTMMLLLSLIAIIVAIVLLSLEMGRYGWDIKAAEGTLQRTAIERSATQDLARASVSRHHESRPS